MVIALCYMLNTMLYIEPLSNIAAHMSGDLAQLILEEALYSIVEL